MRSPPSVASSLCIAAVAALLWTGGSATATTIRRVSDDELAQRSQVIVDTRVIRATAEWNADRTQIHTIVDLEVIEFLKGDLPRDRRSIRLRTLGGVVGDVGMAVIGAPSFSVGERSLICLRPAFERLDFPVVGVSQGRIVAVRDPRTGRLTVPQNGADYATVVAEFKARIARLATLSAGGAK